MSTGVALRAKAPGRSWLDAVASNDPGSFREAPSLLLRDNGHARRPSRMGHLELTTSSVPT
jgi:hypothetical protein